MSRLDILDEITLLYELLNTHNDNICNIYLWMIILSVVAYITYMGFSCFVIYLVWAYHTVHFSYNILANNALTTIFLMYRVTACVYMSNKIMNDSKLMATQVHAACHLFLNYENSGVDSVNFMNLSQLIVHRKPEANFVVFNLDWPMTNAIFGTVIGYLIILIQFDNPTLLQNNNNAQNITH